MSQHLLQQIGPVVPPSDPERAAALRTLAQRDALGLDQPAPTPRPPPPPPPQRRHTPPPRPTP